MRFSGDVLIIDPAEVIPDYDYDSFDEEDMEKLGYSQAIFVELNGNYPFVVGLQDVGGDTECIYTSSKVLCFVYLDEAEEYCSYLSRYDEDENEDANFTIGDDCIILRNFSGEIDSDGTTFGKLGNEYINLGVLENSEDDEE
ncbi:MAG: hypothetical protein IJ642_05280 [Oscillospiraceae bacterium]|nr:hypothetical protein [Oscillospiraceae bacterium]